MFRCRLGSALSGKNAGQSLFARKGKRSGLIVEQSIHPALRGRTLGAWRCLVIMPVFGRTSIHNRL